VSSNKSETFIEDSKTQEQLEAELGKGVEKTPTIGEKPEVTLAELDLSGAFSAGDVINQLEKLPDIKVAEKQMDKRDEYLALAKRIWVIKQAEKDSFVIKCKKGTKDSTGKWKWERDEQRRPLYEDVTFYYTPISLQEKDAIFRMQIKKQDASNKVTLIGIKLRKMADTKDDTAAEDYITNSKIDEISDNFYLANQKYYVEAFKSYYGASDDDIARISFEDITDYSDVAMKKEGVRSPQ
jgi:hypothetical protein